MEHSPEDIQLLVLDVDGVLTNGQIVLDHAGRESKAFYTRDGFAIRSAHAAGLRIAVLSGRRSDPVDHRMGQLGIKHVIQGSADKAGDLIRLARRAGVSLDHTAYLGDDVIDLPALLTCAYPMAVADAAQPAIDAAVYVTQAPGGRGAVREVIEHLLTAQNKWRSIVDHYRGE